MKLFKAYHFLIFLSLTSVSAAVPKYSKAGCNNTCGNVMIPYPFGIGANCSVNKWYIVDCNSSTPRLSTLNGHLEILSINLEDQIVTVNIPKISDCQSPVQYSSQITSIDLGRSPFLFSKSQNKFVVEGCGTAVMMNHGSALTGCSTSCRNDTVSDKSNCIGVTCCETMLPHHLRSYSINLTGMERQSGDGACGSALLVDKNISYVASDATFNPVSLLWTLVDQDIGHVNCCYGIDKERLKVDMVNGTTIDTWKCSYGEPFVGSSYLVDGCSATKECARCEGDNGRCSYTRIYDVDGLAKEWNFTCFHDPSYSEGSYMAVMISIIVGISITSGLGLIAIIYTSYRLIKRTITKRRRKSIFKRINGSLLLKQQEEIDPSLVNKTILFTSCELAKATNNFNENRILGKGGQGTVYKGMLADGRIVAVKKSKLIDESQLEQFINEVVILSQVNHRNVVKLLGCCLETEVPLLVSEFIPNGTLCNRIHDESHEFPLSLNMRLQIATEVAQALAYLHSATSISIYHRDIKTTNILLDDKYRAKVSDFGTSRFVSIDQTHLTTLVKGTLGYLDPEYFQSSQFTDKSDVYSFGVVMVELLTGEKPISLTRFGENRSLVAHFKLAMEEGRVMSIFESLVIKEGSRGELLVLANLAMRCLNSIGRNRPTMKEVAIELEMIRTSHIPSTVQTNIEQVMHIEEISTLTFRESTSTFFSCNDKIIQ